MSLPDLRRFAAALVLACCAAPALALDLPALMTLLGQNRSGEATFTEQRFVKGLDAPLTASGTLGFAAPDRFSRRTLKPRAEAMVVEGNTVTLTRNGRSRSFMLDATPEMAALVEAIRGTLTGNAQTLQRYFSPELSGTAEQWSLALTPLEPRLATHLRAVRIDGRRAEVRSIEMQMADGDRSVMSIEPVRPAPAAASALPSVSPSASAP